VAQIETNWDYSVIRRFFLKPRNGAGLERCLLDAEQAAKWRRLFDWVLRVDSLIHPKSENGQRSDPMTNDQRWEAAMAAHSLLLAWHAIMPWCKCSNFMLMLLQLFWVIPHPDKLLMLRFGSARYYNAKLDPMRRQCLRVLLDDIIELQHQ
jgi:hypothetical protein